MRLRSAGVCTRTCLEPVLILQPMPSSADLSDMFPLLFAHQVVPFMETSCMDCAPPYVGEGPCCSKCRRSAFTPTKVGLHDLKLGNCGGPAHAQ